MRDFNKNNRGGGRSGRQFNDRSGGFRGGGRFNRDKDDRQMHDAVCANCGTDCKVPFRPTGDKPIYCSKCFGNREGNENRRSERRDFSNPRDSRSFRGVGANKPQRSTPDYQKQLDEINKKLDIILKALKTSNKAKEEEFTQLKEKPAVPKKELKKKKKAKPKKETIETKKESIVPEEKPTESEEELKL